MAQTEGGLRRGIAKHSVPKDSWVCKPRRYYDPSMPFIMKNSEHKLCWEQLMIPYKETSGNFVAPHKATMMSLGTKDKVKEVSVRFGLAYWKNLMSNAMYKGLLVEFFSTFESCYGRDNACDVWMFSINNTFSLLRRIRSKGV